MIAQQGNNEKKREIKGCHKKLPILSPCPHSQEPCPAAVSHEKSNPDFRKLKDISAHQVLQELQLRAVWLRERRVKCQGARELMCPLPLPSTPYQWSPTEQRPWFYMRSVQITKMEAILGRVDQGGQTQEANGNRITKRGERTETPVGRVHLLQ